MKPPFTYYGGKQTIAAEIVKLIPEHTSYCEPFVGGAAVFWHKPKSLIEILNDTNLSIVNFYRTLQNDFIELEKLVRITMHSRKAHHEATVIYQNPEMFTALKQAWSVWVLANQSFASSLDNTWGFDKNTKASTSIKIRNKREAFTEEFAIRMQDVQVECADALYIIQSRDTEDAFFYIDPPYFNSHMGHYDGYTESDFKELLKTLSNIKGKFLLSSYPSTLLKDAIKENKWHSISKELRVTVNKGGKGKKKVEVLTANYPINLPDWK